MASAGTPMGCLLSARARLVWNRPTVFTHSFCGVYCHYENISWRSDGHGSRNCEQKDGRHNAAASGDNRWRGAAICGAARLSGRRDTRYRRPGDTQGRHSGEGISSFVALSPCLHDVWRGGDTGYFKYRSSWTRVTSLIPRGIRPM